MLRYLIRLDDATPKMNKAGWSKVETLLDKYQIKPIVGIIPISKDNLFSWEEDVTFWTQTVPRWQEKGWTIAQHGCHHVYRDCGNGVRSEFIGLCYDEQMSLIRAGHDALIQHGVTADCFFAPAHTFDEVTVDVCRDSGFFRFISDGYALYPYVERGMLFVPSIFDTAHKILPFGVYTFILHPSFTTDAELAHLEKFLIKHHDKFESVDQILNNVSTTRKRSAFEAGIHPVISCIRRLRKKVRSLLHGK